MAASITSQTNPECEGANTGQVTVEAIDGTPPYQYSIDGGSNYQNNGTFSGLTAGNYTVEVLDDAGCTVTVNVTIVDGDGEDPTWTNPPTDMTVECDGTADPNGAFANWLTSFTGTDNSGNATVTNNSNGLSDLCGTTGSETVTFTLTDDCGNSISADATFTIEDTIDPTFNEALPGDTTVECDNIPTANTLTASDNCGTATVNLTETLDGNTDACPSEYTITRVWTATDECGNTTSHTQIITVEDTTAPTFNEALPGDATVECDNVPAADTLTASDNCDANVTVSFTETLDGNTDACPSEYTVTRVWSVSDCAGNTTSHTQIITVEDTTAPTFNEALPGDATVECDNVPAADTLTASDNCDANVTVSFTETLDGNTDACPSEYTVTRVWSVSDCAGNTTSHTQIITVEDTTAPTFNEALPGDATVECDNVPAADTLTASDNCDAYVTVDFNEVRIDGSCPSNYTLVRTWTISDCAGNSTSYTQNITVQDTTAPTIDIEAGDIVVECDGIGNSGAIQAWLDVNGGASASDNCGTVTWTNNYGGDTSDCATPIEVIFTATDECGNSTTTTATYAISDTTAPTIDVVASDLTVECDGAGNSTALQNWLDTNGGATASDDCSAVAWSNDFTALSDDCGATGSATVTFTVTDGCGNTSSTTATFTIEDTTDPTFNESLPSDVTVECDNVPTAETLTASDSCSNVTVVLDEVRTDGSCDSNYILVRTWTATDDCGNSISHSQTVTVQDTTVSYF
ncbi:MAG: hypothetical protein R2816_10760 [Flavobacteriaceae bacterium]